MAYDAALGEGDVQRVNIRSIRDWIDKNQRRIKARPNQTLLYSGRDDDLDITKALPAADRKEFMGTPMWARIEQMKKRLAALELPCDFQTLEDVLKSIREHPRIVDRDRLQRHFVNAFEFFDEVARLPKLLPDPKGLSRELWDRLSELFAANAVGDIRILDGLADDYGKLQKDKILLRKELEALLKNDKLSAAGRAVLSKKISAHGDHFDRRHTELIKRLNQDRTRLTKPR